MLMMVPRAAVSADRISEVLHTESSVVPAAEPVTAAPLRGEVELRGVRFLYPGAEVPVLDDVSFRAVAGQTTAIIGSTGAGKTTLLSLIPRLFDVVGGNVLVDGIDVREWEFDALRRRIAIVPQRPYLFSGTIASNLRYGNPDATDDELWAFLEIAQARDFVEAMPDRLEAPIAQGGTNVSGGQRQRLAIARALVRQPEIYLFDDSFSALDLGTDARLRAALRRVTADAAVIVVAQRVSTIVDADQIIVLEDGEVVGPRPPRRPARGLPDLRRDRLLPAERRSRRMSTTPPGKGNGKGPLPGRLPGAGARRGGPPWMNVGQPAEKSMTFGPSARRLLHRLRPFKARLLVIVALCVTSVSLSVVGPKILGRATDIIFAGLVGKQLPAGSTVQQAADQARASGDDNLGEPARPPRRDPRRRHRLRQPAQRAVAGPGAVRRRQPAAVAAGLPADRRRPVGRPRAARRGGGQAEPAAPAVLRRPAARRAAEPRDQRHRQHRADAAADSQPAADVAADHRRRARDDVRDLAGAGADRARRRAAVGARHAADRQALAEAVHRPVAAHRRAQRRHRGGLHRPRAGQGVRPPARGRGAIRGPQRGAVPGQLRGTVRLRHRSCPRRCSSGT